MENPNSKETQLSLEQLERLQFDYSKAMEMIRHYEQLFWQVGAILLAGLFIMIGIVSKEQIYEERPFILIPVIAVTLLIDLFWFLWYNRNRIVVLNRFKRILDIEKLVPEIRNFSYCLQDEMVRFNTSHKDNFGLWLSGHLRHSLILRCFCVLLPTPLIGIYIYSYVRLFQRFGTSLIIHLVLFSLPLLFISVYPMEPYIKTEQKPGLKSFLDDERTS